MEVEWDARKADYHLPEHGVSFTEAATVFYDSLSITLDDPDHSDDVDRFIMIGTSLRKLRRAQSPYATRDAAYPEGALPADGASVPRDSPASGFNGP